MDAESAWSLIDAYFSEHTYAFTRHHIESFRQFLRHNIPLTIKSYNPITMVKFDTAGVEDFKVEVFVGGEEVASNGNGNGNAGAGIRVDRPTMPGPDGAPILQLPYEARIRDQTYQMNLVADVVVRYTVRGVTQPLKTLPGVILGRLPIMLHSDACILHGQGVDVLRASGECPLDQGGYFLVDGKEKVIISQEQMTGNRLFIEPSPKDPDYSFKARLICTGETGETALSPRIVMFKLVRKELPEWEGGAGAGGHGDDGEDGEEGGGGGGAGGKASNDIATALRPFRGALMVSAPGIAGDMPVATLFRALGVESDESIVEHILGHVIDADTQEAFLAFLRPSLAQAAASKLYTQKDVWANLQHRVYFEEPDYVAHVLSNDLFPNMLGEADSEADWASLMSRKAMYLGHLVREIMYVALGIRESSDRDGYAFKRIHVSGMLMSSLFQEAYGKVRDLCRRLLDREYHYGSYKNTGNVTDLIRADNIHYYLPASIITDTFKRSLKGAWGYSEEQDPEQGWVQDVSRISYLGYLSHMRRVNNNLDPSLKIASPHRLHSQQWGIMCPFESPDGAAVGYLKSFALLTQISFGTNPAPIRRCLEDLGTLPLRLTSVALDLRACRVFVNGLWFGVHRDPPTLVRRLRSLRRTGLINAFTSVTWTIAANEIRVLTEAGRACRPLIRVGPVGKVGAPAPLWTPNMPGSWYDWLYGSLLDPALKTRERYYDETYTSPRDIPSLAALSDEALWPALAEHEGVIEFLDIEEVNTQLLALDGGGGAIGPFHTYAEIHPATLLSVVTQNIPFSNHNQAPRNIFHAAQAKQAIGLYATNFNKRFDTASYILHYPQRAIINTRGAHYTRAVDMPNGVNVIVAVATYTGFNQEDGIILNKHSIDRGLFQISAYKTMTAKEGAPNDRTVVRFANIADENEANEGAAIGNVAFADYRLLDKEGLAKAGSKVPKGKKAAIIGMVQEVTSYAEERRGIASQLVKKKTVTNVSRYSDVHHYGVVDKVSVVHADSTEANSYRTAKIRFRKVRRPELGDKHSSRHGQKGVVGMILPQQDMPFTKDGMVPDVIINPHAFPSRMTVGHLVECVFAKLCCMEGIMGDGTVFLPFDPKDVHRRLEGHGFEGAGNEVLYNGRTGEQIATDIFFGPTFYMRLKHMVADKVHARADGPMDQLTRQPTSGRSANGGLRIGEMERDVLLAHGLAQFTKESMMERSDKYAYDVCRTCGVVAKSGNNNSECMACGSEDCAKVETPYAFKLLLQEMQGMGVELRLHTDSRDAPKEVEDSENLEDLQGSDEEGDEEDEEEEFGSSGGGDTEKVEDADPAYTADTTDGADQTSPAPKAEEAAAAEETTAIADEPKAESQSEDIQLEDIEDFEDINNAVSAVEAKPTTTAANASAMFAMTGGKEAAEPKSDIKVIRITGGWGERMDSDENQDGDRAKAAAEEAAVRNYYASGGKTDGINVDAEEAECDPSYATNGYGRSPVTSDVAKHLAYPDIIDPTGGNMMAGND